MHAPLMLWQAQPLACHSKLLCLLNALVLTLTADSLQASYTLPNMGIPGLGQLTLKHKQIQSYTGTLPP
eukprot:363593-Chlamydomonas_euryale.AAC.6